MRTCTDKVRTENNTQRIPVHAAEKQLIAGPRYFCISLNSACFEIKIITRGMFFLMKIRPLIGRRIRIGRRLHAALGRDD